VRLPFPPHRQLFIDSYLLLIVGLRLTSVLPFVLLLRHESNRNREQHGEQHK
jgi:hypothetical protein